MFNIGDTEFLTTIVFTSIIKVPRSWGISGTLYLQSAIAGVMFGRGQAFMELPGISGVDIWVFRNRNS